MPRTSGPEDGGPCALADELSFTVDAPSLRGDEPAMVVVKNTFFELLEDNDPPPGLMAASKSEPVGLRPQARRHRNDSTVSTDISGEEGERPHRPKATSSASSGSISTAASSRDRLSTRSSAPSMDQRDRLGTRSSAPSMDEHDHLGTRSSAPSMDEGIPGMTRDRCSTRSSAPSMDEGVPGMKRDRFSTRSTAPSMDEGVPPTKPLRKLTLSIIGEPTEDWSPDVSRVGSWAEDNPVTHWKTMSRSEVGSPRRRDKAVSFSEFAEVHHVFSAGSAQTQSEAPASEEQLPAAEAQPSAAEEPPPALPNSPPGQWTTPPASAVPPWALRGTIATRAAAGQARGATLVPTVTTPADIVECVRLALSACSEQVACVVPKRGQRGWNITVYISPQDGSPQCPAVAATVASGKEQKKALWDYVISIGQHAVLHATGASKNVFVLGFALQPFMPMPLGFGCAVATMDDPQQVCWSSFAKGFCDNPGSCTLRHPKSQVAINVMLKRARPQRAPRA